MRYGLSLIAGLIVAGALGSAATGGGHADKAILDAVKARQSHMRLNAFNLGLLGAMAKGEVEYDAAAASAAASNLASLATMDMSRYWPPGSDNAALGDDTRALPAIWEAGSTVGENAKALAEAVAAMDTAAGGGLDSLRGAIGPVGKACGACHEKFRKSQN